VNITIRGVVKRFGAVTAVDRADLTVDDGELFTLLGPSGCGKTTLLRLIAGFEQPTSGRILLDGVDVSDVPPHRRNVNTVFQSYALFPHLDVERNVAFGLERKRVPKAEVRRRVGEVLDLVHLQGLGRRRPSQLSGGQQQRVAVARALVLKPSVLLFDEPLSNLDARLRRQMREEIRELQQRLGLTVVYVTHDQQEAMAVSDRIIVMNAGRIEQQGCPRELYERPATPFLARFMGESNSVRGFVRRLDAAREERNEIGIAAQARDIEYARAFKEERAFLREEQWKAREVDLPDVGFSLGRVGVDRDRGIQVWRQVLDHIETTGELSLAGILCMANC
jgi:ABC-type Fe3+/spermidine/putrescine transport system ATPase subunit